MFNRPLLSPDSQLGGAEAPPVINPSDVILYLPLTSNLLDYGYYGLTFTGVDYTLQPIIENGWGKFWNTYNSGTGAYPSSRAGTGQRAMVFNHPIFNAIANSVADFTIEFNVRIQGDGNASAQGASIKVFPFSFVGAAVNAVYQTSVGSAQICAAGDMCELGMTIGSHQAPGGFGFGVGPGGTSTGVAVVCTTDDTAPTSYVNRGIAPVPAGNASAWGPYYIALVRKAGIVSIFVNGMKVNAPFGADEDGDGTSDVNSTWGWSTFGLDTAVEGTPSANSNIDGYGQPDGSSGPVRHGLYIGGCWTYSTYGLDDDLYLQHFRVTTKARYTVDYIPEAIYTV